MEEVSNLKNYNSLTTAQVRSMTVGIQLQCQLHFSSSWSLTIRFHILVLWVCLEVLANLRLRQHPVPVLVGRGEDVCGPFDGMLPPRRSTKGWIDGGIGRFPRAHRVIRPSCKFIKIDLAVTV